MRTVSLSPMLCYVKSRNSLQAGATTRTPPPWRCYPQAAHMVDDPLAPALLTILDGRHKIHV